MSTRAAAAAYLALSLLLTWPLAAGLASDVPGDLGDSLLNMWILAWGAEHVPRLLSGSMGWQEFWHANIFHPEPLALAFSEHLFAQTLQILPVYWITGNIILAYNLIFLSTFALSGLGAYLLVRDLTGDRRAAFIAGLIYGFLPYRIASIPHVQVMSAQWMPFALYGFNRFVSHQPGRGHWALAGGTAALVLQNWSCGYYALYFAPFVPLFVIHRMGTAGRLRDRRCWMAFGAAAIGTSVLTVPFLLPYADAQAVFGFERPLAEIVRFSASAASYVTGSEQLRLWGTFLRFDTRPESETFLGFVPWLLAIGALAASLAAGHAPAVGTKRDGTRRRVRWWVGLLSAITVVQFAAVVSVVVFGGFSITVLGMPLSARSPQRVLAQFVLAAALLLAFSAGARGALRRVARSPVVFFAFCAMVAVWLSLGPLPESVGTRGSALGLYDVFYTYVPGFNGVRVPARFAMVAGMFLSVLAGYGVAALLRMGAVTARAGRARSSAVIVGGLAVLVVAEGFAVPIAVNGVWGQNEATPPGRVFPAAGAPPVYAALAGLPEGSVVTEFPFGDAAWEIRYVYYSHAHWKRITNGYSGAFPPAYQARVARWRQVDRDPAAAWRALVESGTTHVVVHRAAFGDPRDADRVEAWLHANGAGEQRRFDDGDKLYGVR